MGLNPTPHGELTTTMQHLVGSPKKAVFTACPPTFKPVFLLIIN